MKGEFIEDTLEFDSIYCMDCFDFVEKLPDESINMVMTSPPYWGLRDYGVEGQIGLEPDFREYVKKLVELFHEIKRVLKRDGSFYLNLGDTYSASGGAGGQYEKWHSLSRIDGLKKYEGHKDKTIPAKCLLGIPWRVALSLIDDKWILRNDIIWHKPNGMPASVKDRLTNTYEHVFHFVKSKKYYYNLDAIRVPHKFVTVERVKRYIKNKERYDPSKHKTDPFGMHQPPTKVLENSAKKGLNPLGKNPGDVVLTERASEMIDFFKRKGSGGNPGHGIEGSMLGSGHPLGKNPGDVYEGKFSFNPESFGSPRARHSRQKYDRFSHSYFPKGKNPGDFWDLCTRPFKGAHFAVYPETLCIRPILSSSRPGDVVFDPFIGSGTTAMVAKRLGRRFLGCDIKPEYVKMAEDRLKTVQIPHA